MFILPKMFFQKMYIVVLNIISIDNNTGRMNLVSNKRLSGDFIFNGATDWNVSIYRWSAKRIKPVKHKMSVSTLTFYTFFLKKKMFEAPIKCSKNKLHNLLSVIEICGRGTSTQPWEKWEQTAMVFSSVLWWFNLWRNKCNVFLRIWQEWQRNCSNHDFNAPPEKF